MMVSMLTQVIRVQSENITQKQLASILGVSERTVRRWKSPTKQTLKKRGRKLKIGGEVWECLIKYLMQNNTCTQQNLVNYLWEQAGCAVSRSTISRTLKRENITYKKLTPYYLEQKPLLKEIKKFVSVVELLPQQQLAFLDECGFLLSDNPRYGYAPCGQRAFTWKLGNHHDVHTRYSLILCIYIQKVRNLESIHYRMIEGTVNVRIFHEFLQEINFSSRHESYLIMDNSAVHKATQACEKLGLPTIKKLLASKNIAPLYLPPYTPQLNPVELCFNTIKHFYRKHRPKTEEELRIVIDQAISLLKEKDFTKYFHHCLNYFSENKSPSNVDLIWGSKSGH